MNDSSKIAISLLAGIAVGAALGILFAPDRGAETRDKISDSLKDLGESIKDRAAKKMDNLTSFKDRVVQGLKSKIENAEDEFTGVTDQV